MSRGDKIVILFWWAVVRRAWRESWETVVGFTKTSATIALLLSAVVLLLSGQIQGEAGVWEGLRATASVIGANIMVLLSVFLARAFTLPSTIVHELGGLRKARIRGWYSESDPVCCQIRKIDPRTHGNLKHQTTFRVGLVNLTDRIENVRVSCGPTDPPSGVAGTTFVTYPNEDETFALPRSAGPNKPAVYITIAVCEVISYNVDNHEGRSQRLWTRYNVAPWMHPNGVLQGVHFEETPQLRLIVRVECPTDTIEIACRISLADDGCLFALE